MKAAIIRQHGGVESIEIADMPEPVPAHGEVLLEMKAAALNHLDIWVRRGGRAKIPMPHVMGSDGAGVVEAVGPDVSGVAVNDAVIINPGLSCGHCEHCRRGDQSVCESFGIIGLSRGGVFAQKVVVPATNVLLKPPHLDFNEAAALGVAYATAWRMLFSRGGLRPGQCVLIQGIGGGVAIAALQLAKAGGAGAIVTSGDDEKLRLAAALGADHGINYRTSDTAARVREITGGRGVDLVIDSVGAATLAANMNSVRRGGTIVNCGVTGGSDATLNMQQLYWNHITLRGSTLANHYEFRQLLRAMSVNKIKPIIDSILPLDQARAATQRMEDGKQLGKIVLAIG